MRGLEELDVCIEDKSGSGSETKGSLPWDAALSGIFQEWDPSAPTLRNMTRKSGSFSDTLQFLLNEIRDLKQFPVKK
jgi:hypothetical protein